VSSSGAPRDEESARLLAMLGGKWLAAAVSAAASLEIPDALLEGSSSHEELAERLSCDPTALRRLMRVLLGQEIVKLGADQRYELTPLGRRLCADELGPLARFTAHPSNWNPWSSLADSVQSGDAAFAVHHDVGLFDYLDRHADVAELYHAAIQAFTRDEGRALAREFDFSTVRCVADLGGGSGMLLVDVLQQWKQLEGILVERPVAAREAKRNFDRAGLSGRCEAQTGDFFAELPTNVDVFVLKHVIHNWPDDVVVKLLERCGEVVGPDGAVLVIEGLRLPDGYLDLTGLLDLEMLVLCGAGRERSKPELRRLFAAAGLRLDRAARLSESAWLLVARPR